MDAGTRNSSEGLLGYLRVLFELSLGSLWSIFGTKFWKILRQICRNRDGDESFFEALMGSQKLLKPLQKPLIWVVVKKF